MPSTGRGVIRKLAVPGSQDVILLFDPEQRPAGVEPWHPFPNILRLTRTGDVVWRCALLAQETAWKCYLSVEWRGESLIAQTPSYEVTLDPTSGAIMDSVFTK